MVRQFGYGHSLCDIFYCRDLKIKKKVRWCVWKYVTVTNLNVGIWGPGHRPCNLQLGNIELC